MASSTRIQVLGAKHTTIENNHISGWPRLAIYLANLAQYTIIRGNRVVNSYDNSINLGSSYGTMQYTLIENNVLDGTLVQDGIQFEHNYDLPAGTVDADSNRGVVIRNNIICNDGENSIDLKGGAYVVIEGNIIYGTEGNNEGGYEPGVGDIRYPGAQTIMHGTGPSSRNVIIRRNVLYDGPGGIMPENYYKIYNNTLVYNNRDYTGPNSSWDGHEQADVHGDRRVEGKQSVGIKNNIIGGHNAADIAIGTGASSLDIDNNLYFNDNGALLVDYRGKSDWSLVPFSQWSSFLVLARRPGGRCPQPAGGASVCQRPGRSHGISHTFRFPSSVEQSGD